MMLDETYTLNNGIEIPKIGLGTWFIGDDVVAEAVQKAVAVGYRHIDTAQAYQNERGVGEGVRNSSVPRQELFVTTKLAAEVKNYDEAVASIDASLKTLGLEYIDLMIIHSPRPWMEYHKDDSYEEGNREAWRALEDAYQAGKIKAIGVSNFAISDLQNIFESCRVKPMVNQVLAHITNTPDELIEYCKAQDILVEAYSPVAHGELMKNEQVLNMAQSYGVSIPQLAIRFCLQLGLLPIPKTANSAHMQNNADVDFVISETDMATLRNLERIKDYGDASMFPVYGGTL